MWYHVCGAYPLDASKHGQILHFSISCFHNLSLSYYYKIQECILTARLQEVQLAAYSSIVVFCPNSLENDIPGNQQV